MGDFSKFQKKIYKYFFEAPETLSGIEFCCDKKNAIEMDMRFRTFFVFFKKNNDASTDWNFLIDFDELQ